MKYETRKKLEEVARSVAEYEIPELKLSEDNVVYCARCPGIRCPCVRIGEEKEDFNV
jgi:hypothetical protein